MPATIDRKRVWELIDQGLTNQQVANAVSCHIRSIQNIQRQGRDYIPSTDALVNPLRVAELTRVGYSTPQIAEKLGCSTRQVTRVRGRVGVAQPAPSSVGRPADPEKLAMAAELVEQHASIGEIHRTTGLHKDTIKRHFPNAGQDPREWMELWGQIRNKPKMRRLFDEMGGLS